MDNFINLYWHHTHFILWKVFGAIDSYIEITFYADSLSKTNVLPYKEKYGNLCESHDLEDIEWYTSRMDSSIIIMRSWTDCPIVEMKF